MNWSGEKERMRSFRLDFISRIGNGIPTVASKIVRTMPEIDDVWPGDHAAVLTVFELE